MVERLIFTSGERLRSTRRLDPGGSTAISPSVLPPQREGKQTTTVLRNVAIAERGVFKSRRGSFDDGALFAIARVMARQSSGTLCYFSHSDDLNGLGLYVGTWRNPKVEGAAVRADLYLSAAAARSPRGDLPAYVVALARENQRALAVSLTFEPQRLPHVDSIGRIDRSKPDIWVPKTIYSADLVSEGDATNGLGGSWVAEVKLSAPSAEWYRRRLKLFEQQMRFDSSLNPVFSRR